MPDAPKKSFWDNLAAEAFPLIRQAFQLLRRHSLAILLGAVIIAGLAWFLIPRDHQLLQQLQGPAPDKQTVAAARAFSLWGDYFTGTFIIVFLLWLFGMMRHSGSLQRAALACLLAATCAGLLNNTLRFTVGRPRPLAHLPDGIYGPSIAYRMNSFPSGHSATSVATAVSLLITLPPVGIPACIAAGGVVWSRMELDCHNPSDVLVGAAFGLLFGLAFGFAARQAKP